MKLKHLLTTCVTLLFATNLFAQTIRVASWLPPTNPMNAVVIPEWGKAISKATNGRLKVEIVYGMGHPKTMWNLVEDGIVDASYSYHGYVPGRFELPQVVEQPGLGTNAEAASYALWKTYQKYFAKSHEFDGLKLLALFTHGPGQIYSNFPINDIKDLENKKIRIGGGVQSQLAERFHITPVGAPAPKVYEMMQQGVIDGAFLPVGEMKTLRLAEVTKDLTLFPNGLYMGSFSMFMNPDVFDDLSQQDQEAINKASGEVLSVLAGKAWDAGDVAGLQSAREAGVNIHVVKPNSTLAKEVNQRIDNVAAEWVKGVDKKGFNGDAALSYLRETAMQYAAKHKE